MLFHGAELFRQGRLTTADLRVEGGHITAIGNNLVPKAGEKLIDGQGCLLLPGLTDMHLHGALGQDFSDADADGLRELQRYEARQGVTQICPTSMTLAPERLEEIFRHFATHARLSPADGAQIVGLHMEGPYVNAKKLGAQNPVYIQPVDVDDFLHYQALARGQIRTISLAPEQPGALDFIRRLKGQVLLSLAHSEASYETSLAAIEAGVSHITHLFNAMPGIHHRRPGPIVAAYENPQVSVEMIGDGLHIHAAVLRLAFQLFAGRICLISDSMRATGLADGEYEFGGQMIQVQDHVARLADGNLAGSVCHQADGLRRAIKFGIPLEAALTAATETPAKVLGIADQVGVLAVGRRANLILADRDLTFQEIWLGGKLLCAR